jgi:hypothetical protein
MLQRAHVVRAITAHQGHVAMVAELRQDLSLRINTESPIQFEANPCNCVRERKQEKVKEKNTIANAVFVPSGLGWHVR